MITVLFNNQQFHLQQEATIINFLLEIKNPGDGIAVAVNDTVITKSEWNKTQLKNKDNILIIKATQGG